MKFKLTIERRKKIIGLCFAAPWIIGLLLFWIYPIVMSFIMSFHRITIYQADFHWEFIGMGNYNRLLLIEAAFLDNLIPYLIRVSIMVPVIVVFAVCVALLLNQQFYGRGLFRAIFFLPVLFTTGGVVIMLMTDIQGGGGQAAREAAGVIGAAATTTVSFLQNEALHSLVMGILPPRIAVALTDVLDSFVLVLWYAGIQITLLLAGCQSIPRSLYEAASIDGANSWETLWKITLPGILPFILVSMIYTLVDFSTLIDNPILALLTNAVDEPATQGLGYASAIGWVYQLVIMALIGLIFLLFRKSSAMVQS